MCKDNFNFNWQPTKQHLREFSQLAYLTISKYNVFFFFCKNSMYFFTKLIRARWVAYWQCRRQNPQQIWGIASKPLKQHHRWVTASHRRAHAWDMFPVQSTQSKAVNWGGEGQGRTEGSMLALLFCPCRAECLSRDWPQGLDCQL